MLAGGNREKAAASAGKTGGKTTKGHHREKEARRPQTQGGAPQKQRLSSEKLSKYQALVGRRINVIVHTYSIPLENYIMFKELISRAFWNETSLFLCAGSFNRVRC